jgi:hypothetical protein
MAPKTNVCRAASQDGDKLPREYAAADQQTTQQGTAFEHVGLRRYTTRRHDETDAGSGYKQHCRHTGALYINICDYLNAVGNIC